MERAQNTDWLCKFKLLLLTFTHTTFKTILRKKQHYPRFALNAASIAAPLLGVTPT